MIKRNAEFEGYKEQLRAAYRGANVVYVEEDGKEIRLSSGGASRYYVDVKKAYGSPELLSMTEETMWLQLGDKATCIVAGGYGGVPLAALLAKRHGLRLVLLEEVGENKGLAEFRLPKDEELENLRNVMMGRATCIAASGYDALVAGTLISVKCRLKMSMIRETPKGHGPKDNGRGRFLDGYVPGRGDVVEVLCGMGVGEDEKEALRAHAASKGAETVGSGISLELEHIDSVKLDKEKVIVIDDVLTTGRSVEELTEYARRSGCKKIHRGVVVKRSEGGPKKNIAYLLRAEEIIS